MKNSLIAVASLSLFGSALALAAPSLEWHLDKAIAAGTGCGINQASMYAVDNILAVNNPDMVIYSSSMFDGLAARKACTIRVPITVPAGYFIAEGRSVNLVRSHKSAESVLAQAKIMMSVGTTRAEVLSFDAQIGGDYQREISFVDLSSSRDSLCQSSVNTDTILGLNMAIAVNKASAWDNAFLALGAPGAALEIASFELRSCL